MEEKQANNNKEELESYMNEKLLPDTDEKLITVSLLREQTPHSCSDLWHNLQHATLDRLTKSEVDLQSNKWANRLKRIDANYIDQFSIDFENISNLTVGLNKAADESSSSEVVSNYANVLQYMSKKVLNHQ